MSFYYDSFLFLTLFVVGWSLFNHAFLVTLISFQRKELSPCFSMPAAGCALQQTHVVAVVACDIAGSL